MSLPIHHLALSVSNRLETADWLEGLLGPAAERIEVAGEGFTRILLIWPQGIWISVAEHDARHSEPFSHLNIGLDHFAMKCESKDEIDEWVTKLDKLNYVRDPLKETSGFWSVTARTPDNIPFEFICRK